MGRKLASRTLVTGSFDASIALIAGRQYGVVAVAQLHRLGLKEKAIRRRVDAGRLHRVHRGVYAVGHRALAPEGRWLAAVLAVGGGPSEGGGRALDHWGVAVSHRSAAALWGLLAVGDEPVDVTTPGQGGKARRAGIRVHRPRSLAVSEVTLHRGLPVTTPARTIADLRLALANRYAGALPAWELRRVARQAGVLGLPVDEETRADRSRSDLEDDFQALCKRRCLPEPQVNAPIGPYIVDFLWAEPRVIVETDAYLYHRGKVAFQDDRGRDLDLRRRGYVVLRLSEKQVNEEPDLVAEVLATTLQG